MPISSSHTLFVPTYRLDVENRTETQFRNVLKLEEDSLRGGILSTLEKFQKRQSAALKGMQECEYFYPII